MNRYSPDRILRMRRKIRSQVIKTILNDFDGELMEFSSAQRALKYNQMRESVFRFFRGSAYLFYFDVSHIPFPYHTPPEKPTWIQGDLHFENFGAFQDKDGDIVYDINDFDEGYLGSYLFDLLRMSVSIGLVCEMMNLDKEQTEESIRAYLEAYYKQICRFSDRKDDMQSMQFTSSTTSGPIRKLLKKQKAFSAVSFLDEVTETRSAIRRFSRSAEIMPADAEERRDIASAWEQYLDTIAPAVRKPASYYTIKDLAIKHGSGTASLGLDRYYILIEGHRDPEGKDDIVLEAKEVRAPIPAYFLLNQQKFWELFEHHGHRVAATQQAMHHDADPFLGWFTLGDRHFYVRERSPFKKRLKVKKIHSPDDLQVTLKLMGRITAKIHARADNELRDNQAILDYHAEHEIAKAMGRNPDQFAGAIAVWAMNYCHQVREDYDLFVEIAERQFGAIDKA